MQGCNFVKFSRGHVGSLIKYFRSPQENLRAHNEIEFILKSKNAETVKMQNTNCPRIFPAFTLSTFLLSIQCIIN